MSNPMRTLLVGLGARGKKWARILQEEPSVETIGYVDILDDNLEWAKSFDSAAEKSSYSSMEKALSELEPEFVVLVTPPVDRYKDVMTIFEHGSHLLSEKPLSLDLDEGLRMVQAAQEAKLGFAVGLNFRYQHCVTKARSILKSGEIGKPGLVGYTYWRYRDAYTPGLNRFPITMRHPMLYEQTVHHLDEIRYVYDAEVERLYCRTSNPAWSQYSNNATALVYLEMTDDIEVHYFGTWAGQTKIKDHFYWRTDCDNGSLFQFEFFSDLRIARGNTSTEVEKIDLPYQERLIDDARVMLRNIVADLQQGNLSPQPTAIDHLRTFAVIAACEVSSERGETIAMKDFYDEHNVPQDWR